MTSTLPPLVQALSGAVGSASAGALTYPLDLITTRLQLDSSVKAKRRGGVKGGLRLLLFIVYGSRTRKWLKQRKNDNDEEKEGMGWAALYDGLQSDLYATIISNFFYFYFYSFLRSLSIHGLNDSITLPSLRRLLRLPPFSPQSKSKHRKPSLWEDILLGFVAGVASRAVSTPLNIITLRLQSERADAEDDDDTSSSDGSLTPTSESSTRSDASPSPIPSLDTTMRKEDMGIADVARLIYAEQGLKGFWKGFTTSALLSINPSITLAVFQFFRKLIVYSRRRRNPADKNMNLTPAQAFFVGAIASNIGSSILYPLILAKKRLQASLSPEQRRATLVGVLKEAYMGTFDPHSASLEPDTAPGEHPPTFVTRPSYKRAKSSRRGRAEQKMEGVEGLYQGWQMQILKGFLNQGVTFLVKGRIEQAVVSAYLARARAGRA